MTKYCDYGCGQEAKYQFKNNKWCCESYFSKCPEIRKKNSNGQIGMKRNDETRKKQSISHKKRYTKELKEEYSNRMIEKYKNPKEREKQRKIFFEKIWIFEQNREKHKNRIKNYYKNNSKYTIYIIKEKYPIFYKEEKLRYKPNTKRIQVQCKKCKKWFTPKSQQLYDRIYNLESINGTNGSYLYCSEECKQTCPLYNLRSDPYETNDIPFTPVEKQIWNQTVLEQDNYECQMCGSKEKLHCHHIVPVKINPMLALDPTNGIVLCESCHYKVGHKDECSTGNIANKICSKKSDKNII